MAIRSVMPAHRRGGVLLALLAGLAAALWQRASPGSSLKHPATLQDTKEYLNQRGT